MPLTFSSALPSVVRYYAKRCFLALAESLAKHMLTLKDSTLHEIIEFLEAADQHGAKIKTSLGPNLNPDGTHPIDANVDNVAYEARQIKRMYLRLQE